MRSYRQIQELSQSLVSAIWIRSGGRCECSCCAHHEDSSCKRSLVAGGWSARSILPAWLKSEQMGVSMFEAVCESCLQHQDLVATASLGYRTELDTMGNVK